MTLAPIFEAMKNQDLMGKPINLFISPANAFDLQVALRGLVDEIPLKGEAGEVIAIGCYWYIDPDEPDFRLERRS